MPDQQQDQERRGARATRSEMHLIVLEVEPEVTHRAEGPAHATLGCRRMRRVPDKGHKRGSSIGESRPHSIILGSGSSSSHVGSLCTFDFLLQIEVNLSLQHKKVHMRIIDTMPMIVPHRAQDAVSVLSVNW